ncbi:MAG: hypothetical protein HC915_07925 [Anaerolineae bacterium]|nr:hypothetical protein [Anaerolineae bacterium]
MTTQDPIFGELATAFPTIEELDVALTQRAIVVLDEEHSHIIPELDYASGEEGGRLRFSLEELEATYGESEPELFHAIEEFHHILYDEFPETLENARGYIMISDKQPNVKRVQVVFTWLEEDEEGNEFRTVASTVAFVHAESEWHAH